jgi:hypothetical protein
MLKELVVGWLVFVSYLIYIRRRYSFFQYEPEYAWDGMCVLPKRGHNSYFSVRQITRRSMSDRDASSS